jgi:hypothetical protein
MGTPNHLRKDFIVADTAKLAAPIPQIASSVMLSLFNFIRIGRLAADYYSLIITQDGGGIYEDCVKIEGVEGKRKPPFCTV